MRSGAKWERSGNLSSSSISDGIGEGGGDEDDAVGDGMISFDSFSVAFSGESFGLDFVTEWAGEDRTCLNGVVRACK